jgi:AcrR family transcriptional regulator
MAPVSSDPTIRRQMVNAARDILATDPEASIELVVRRAGVSRATFYRHFRSRDALLSSIAHEPRPPARTRILVAAQEMLIRTSLSDLAMDDLARAADVSRGTLYRIFPGKAALMDGLIEAYSPLEVVREIVTNHRDEPPSVVLPMTAKAIVGVAGERLGLMRAMFLELTAGSEAALSGMRPAFIATLGVVAEYMTAQMNIGRMRRMHPLVALQAFIGPIFFHLLSRPVLERFTEFPMSPQDAVGELMTVIVAGLDPPTADPAEAGSVR